MLKKANQYLKKLNKSYVALEEANINNIIKNPVVLEELESKRSLLKSKFQREKIFQFVLNLQKEFKYSDLTDEDRAKLLNLLRKVDLSRQIIDAKFQ